MNSAGRESASVGPRSSFGLVVALCGGGCVASGGLAVDVQLAGDGEGRVRGGAFAITFNQVLPPYFIDCPGRCGYRGEARPNAVFEAVPAPGSTFEGWSGDCAEGNARLGFIPTLDGNTVWSCRATFRRAQDAGSPDGAAPDAAQDAAQDAGSPDGAAPDAGPDAGPSRIDAAPDADVVAPVDAPLVDLGATPEAATSDAAGEDIGTLRSCGPRTAAGACVPGTPGCEIVDVSVGSGGYDPGACAVFADGSLRCWSAGCGAPGLVTGLGRVRSARHGENFFCVTRSGATRPVACWGINDSAQFGARAPTSSGAPVETALPDGALRLGGSSGFSITSPGVTTAWGSNRDGQLGDGTVEAPSATRGVDPHEVRFAGLRELAIDPFHGWTTCGVFDAGEVRCWGRGVGGHFGTARPTTAQSAVPVAVPGITGARALAIASRFACAVRTDDELWCWGLGNDPRMAGAGLTPVRVLDRVTQVAVGGSMACALRDDATVWCWGSPRQVGNGGADFVASPTAVRGVSGARAIYAGFSTVCAWRGAADLLCWGDLATAGGSDGSPVPVAVRW